MYTFIYLNLHMQMHINNIYLQIYVQNSSYSFMNN